MELVNTLKVNGVPWIPSTQNQIWKAKINTATRQNMKHVLFTKNSGTCRVDAVIDSLSKKVIPQYVI